MKEISDTFLACLGISNTIILLCIYDIFEFSAAFSPTFFSNFLLNKKFPKVSTINEIKADNIISPI